MDVHQEECDRLGANPRPAPALVWIDLANSPHVLLFASLIPRLRRRGAEVMVTARDFAQTRELLGSYGVEAQVIGGHTGRNRAAKAARIAARALALLRAVRGRGVDLAVSHGSYAQLVAARIAGIPAVTLMDYEHQPANHLSFRLARRVIVPSVFPDEDLIRCGANGEKVVRYSGLKEEVYLADFVPDPRFVSALQEAIEPRLDDPAILERSILAVLRPPATFALYHGFENALFDGVLDRIAGAPGAFVLVSPRTAEQAESILAGRRGNVRILARPVRGLDLLARADLVVSAGGTMNREAALLGTPAYTVLAAPLGAVDRWLIGQGRLVQISSPGELERIMLCRRGERHVAPVRSALADEIAGMILAAIPIRISPA